MTATQSNTRLFKIAPGEDAEFWESDCLPQRIICVGWDEVGDLRQYRDFESFRKAFETAFVDSFNGNQSTVTRKARELWLLRELREGDLVATNQGTKKILAVGKVQAPGYLWDASREKFRHTVKVDWNTKRSGTIEPIKRWANITVEELTGVEMTTILALGDQASAAVSQLADLASINRIYYGPPGTGKTRQLRQLQEEKYTETPTAQDRNAWLDALVADYGWREVIAATVDTLESTKVPAILRHELVVAKARCYKREKNLSQTVWGYLQHHTPETVLTVQIGRRSPPFIFSKDQNSVWTLLPDWQDEDEEAAVLAKLYKKGPTKTAAPIKRYRQVTFHPSYSYEDFIRGIRPVPGGDDDRTEFRMVDGVLKQICDEARANPTKRFALFIDEINRGNIAKIFGELITLIEPDKRLRLAQDGTVLGGMAVQLPGDGAGDVMEPPFGVPANLDLYGTMNTADRSIALLDIALRRRFEFEEMEPNYTLFSPSVEGVDVGALLRQINDRLEYLLDRDHRIGHAYLMKAKTVEQLRHAFAKQVIPLLQEYFFDDLAKVALVLSGPDGTSPFVKRERLNYETLFQGAQRPPANPMRERFIVTSPAEWSAADFVSVYTKPQTIEQAPPETT
ncbi:MAG: AAA family ATPase [Opitutaceae bacterium]|jgi:5-methylcytosine-specific restriction protein B|nr:AAA family ATPase [Opitutaceae bacterium]MBP8962803.1 AAA family ATPase [Opitutaceae bacterium]